MFEAEDLVKQCNNGEGKSYSGINVYIPSVTVATQTIIFSQCAYILLQ